MKLKFKIKTVAIFGTGANRHEFLPMTAPSPGLWETNWAETWLKVREELKIPFHETSVVMPAPQPDATAGERPLDSQEAAAWLRLLLHGDSNVNPERKVSSHSLKTTMLSFAARRGLGMDIRLQLGYHTGPHKMGLTYSRDGAAASLMALEQMVCEIKTGLYFPDETRSGRIKTRPESADSTVIEIKDEAVDSEKIASVEQEVHEFETSRAVILRQPVIPRKMLTMSPGAMIRWCFVPQRRQVVSSCGNTPRVVCCI